MIFCNIIIYCYNIIYKIVSIIPLAVIGIVIALWLSGDRGEILLVTFRNTFDYVLQQFPELEMVFDFEAVSEAFTSAMFLLIVPIGEICSVVPVLLAESAIHKIDEKWQSDFAFMKMPNYYFYVLLALSACLVISYILQKFSDEYCFQICYQKFCLAFHPHPFRQRCGVRSQPLFFICRIPVIIISFPMTHIRSTAIQI